jgi:hypothetical protein
VVPEGSSSVHDSPRASKYIEHSTFQPKENVGFSIEATILFKSGSNRPQFVSINKTLDILGRSFNFLEVSWHSVNALDLI